ncbi:MAG: phenylalanine--tRNA ligase subunit alpha [Planctomycetaceae bacterium]|jgi:phenylalanyl-tRNA synthetase alpha chain|nr:phenylalanine--tRNA ligase subunit alpha [Planctomycetaceae bacterium]
MIQDELLTALSHVTTLNEVEQIRIQYLGRKGIITNLAKETDFSKLSPEQKKNFGQELNQLKNFATEQIQETLNRLTAQNQNTKTSQVHRLIDLTVPGSACSLGALHPISMVQMELEEIFEGMGFTVLDSPEAETEFNNFESINIPSDHPARDMQDTFWLKNEMVLRTHTSSNQVRALKRFGTPFRGIFPGRCFRYESIDPSHENTFYQCEGLMVDRNISVANLISVMKTLLSEVFKREVKVRLRPGFFPFVEPGFELDLNCLFCGGSGCPTCGDGWIKLIPCGLTHPKVLEFGGIDPKEFSGFAFGLGLTRLAMMKYGIRDIRYFNSGDVRFYEQFAPIL